MEQKKKVVVAYSGGLDTSYTVMYLAKEMGYEVHAACANTGGFSDEQLKTEAMLTKISPMMKTSKILLATFPCSAGWMTSKTVCLMRRYMM